MLPILGALGSMGSSLLGGLFGNSQVQQQENFQADMSNTAYQRSSADMKAAGLNPMMMFGSGSAASTPNGASAQNPIQDPTQSIVAAVNSANQAKLASANVDNIKADTTNKIATTPNIDANTAKLKADAVNANLQQYVIKNNISSSGSDALVKAAGVPVANNSALSAKNQMDMDPSVRRLLDQVDMGTGTISHVVKPMLGAIAQ